MSKVILQGYIVVADRDLSAVETELPKHIIRTRLEEGCLEFQVTRDSYNTNIFNVYEEFTDRNALEAHRERVKTSNWGKVSAGAERHYKISDARV
ncbi:putative quinol monooxygenase [Agarilytica rhodophyticola]|uniref:putative quinol monooxygenase n=1 Tax=Agarilytica rhodophyticola TaxID=1737490 RepID=UPI000B3490DB|nr:antibiotic biosynthesis monooxygenase [Agarilytica rhodophyticola]